MFVPYIAYFLAHSLVYHCSPLLLPLLSSCCFLPAKPTSCLLHVYTWIYTRACLQTYLLLSIFHRKKPGRAFKNGGMIWPLLCWNFWNTVVPRMKSQIFTISSGTLQILEPPHQCPSALATGPSFSSFPAFLFCLRACCTCYFLCIEPSTLPSSSTHPSMSSRNITPFAAFLDLPPYQTIYILSDALRETCNPLFCHSLCNFVLLSICLLG